MRRALIPLVLILAAPAAPLAAQVPPPAVSSEASAPAARHGRIVVTGEGEAAAKPDMATLSLGVSMEADTAAEAVAAASEAVAQVIETLRAGGIEARDLQTSGLDLQPRWEHDPEGRRPPEIRGFVAANSLSVRVRDLGSLGALLDRVVRDGANTFNGLRFGIQEPQGLADTARRAAVEDARRRAEVLAEAAGVRLGPLLEISESSGAPRPMPMAEGRFLAASDAKAVPLAEGEVSLEAAVTLTFAIAPVE